MPYLSTVLDNLITIGPCVCTVRETSEFEGIGNEDAASREGGVGDLQRLRAEVDTVGDQAEVGLSGVVGGVWESRGMCGERVRDGSRGDGEGRAWR